MSLLALFERHVVAATLKQSRLREMVGDAEWSADTVDGVLEFAGVARLTADVAGTASRESGTFLWGWEHPSVPTERAALARRVRDVGLAERVPELTTQHVPLTVLDEHRAGIVAAGITGADAYYVAPHGDLSVVFLIRDAALSQRAYALIPFATDLTAVATAAEFDHAQALRHFDADPPDGVAVESHDGVVVVRSGIESARIDLDRTGRIADIRVDVPPKATSRRRWRFGRNP